ncbi:trihelix transcription factor GT-2-like [Ischnura elegans]|uniref:trihelix transcription factor GT-2-like n=1 Tax=Ischnura elegans TaxID=197161 RepID=UPI001ED8B050|nr:trihelix transcription factor GT-2-like [Ischnura elegans]
MGPNDVVRDWTLFIAVDDDFTSNKIQHEVSKTPRIKDWDDTSIRLLISEYGDRFAKVGEDTERSTEENRKVWKEITRKLKKSGYSFSVKNARKKWDLLEEAYVNMASRNIHPGLKRITCPYGRELTAILNPGGMKNYIQIEEELQKEMEKASEE